MFYNFLFFAPLIGVLLLAGVQIIPWNGQTISFDPYETKSFMLTFTGILLTGESLLHFATTRKRIKTLVYLVLIIGGGSALFGLARPLLLSAATFLTPFIDQQVQYAQFVNRNHFALLMEMTLGLAFGLLLRGQIARRSKPIFWIIIAVSCWTIIATDSRGGILSAVGVILATVFIHLITGKEGNFETESEQQQQTGGRRSKKIVIAFAGTSLLFIIAVFTVAYLGGDAVAGRLETVPTEIQGRESPRVRRLDIWKSTIELIKGHPIAGAGFGAYSRAITLYDTSINKFSLQQAHNDYLEVLANGGIIAFLLMLAFILMVVKNIQREFRSADPFRQGSCFGAAAGMCGVMLHNFVDFGLHVIVNALVLTVLIVIATARISKTVKT